jgi:hypothetical protein
MPTSPLTPEDRLMQIAAALDRVPPARLAAAPRVRRPRRRTRIAVVAATGLLLLGGVATASGLFERDARQAFDPAQILPRVGRTVDPSQARMFVRATTPDGGAVELWETPMSRQGTTGRCMAILLGDAGRTEAGKPYRASTQAACAGDASNAPLSTSVGERWVSGRTGQAYLAEGGVAGAAARIEYRFPDHPTIAATVEHGRYLVFLPEARTTGAYRVVALDAAGRELAVRQVAAQDGTSG